MRIALNILYLIPGEVGGTETYARELISHLPKKKGDTYYIYCSRESANLFTESDNFRVIVLPFSAHSRPLRMLFEQLILPFYLLAHSIDVVFSLGYSSPWLSPARSVVTIHDLNWHYHPEDFTPFSRLIWELTTRLSARSSTHIITDSEASADSITKVLRIKLDKVTPILHAAPKKVLLSPAEVRNRLKRLGINGKYISTVVAGYPHKNLITLLRAFRKVSHKSPDLSLIVCGLGGKADHMAKNYIQKNKLGKKISILGYVTREDLVAVYMGSSLFVFPSAYEGFGYPPIEAMQYGVPVISSDAHSLSEVVGDGGALVEPYDVAGMASSIAEILNSPHKQSELRKSGKNRLAKLSWEKTLSSTMQILTRVGARS